MHLVQSFREVYKYNVQVIPLFDEAMGTVFNAVIASMVPLLGINPNWSLFTCSFRIGAILLKMIMNRILDRWLVMAMVLCSSHLLVLGFLGSAMKFDVVKSSWISPV